MIQEIDLNLLDRLLSSILSALRTKDAAVLQKIEKLEFFINRLETKLHSESITTKEYYQNTEIKHQFCSHCTFTWTPRKTHSKYCPQCHHKLSNNKFLYGSKGRTTSATRQN